MPLLQECEKHSYRNSLRKEKSGYKNGTYKIIARKHTQIVFIPKPLWQNCAKLHRKQTKVCPFSPPIQSLDVKHKSIQNEKHSLLLSENRMLPPPSRHITAPLSEPRALRTTMFIRHAATLESTLRDLGYWPQTAEVRTKAMISMSPDSCIFPNIEKREII